MVFGPTNENNKRVMKNIDLLYERIFSKYYGPNDLADWCEWDISFKGGMDAIKSKIEELLNTGHKVKTGYRASSIRDAHCYIVFYKE